MLYYVGRNFNITTRNVSNVFKIVLRQPKNYFISIQINSLKESNVNC